MNLAGVLPFSLLPVPQGSSTSPEVPGVFDVSLGGIGYFIDWDDDEGYRHFSAPLLRTQADTSDAVGEASINPEGPWRRSSSTWHFGAGQTHRDRPESLPTRFRSSKGIDPWTDWELTLLHDTDESLSSASTNLQIVTAGTRCYVADNQTVRYSTDPFAATPTWTAVTGTPGAAITGLASDGFRVLIGYGASGVYKTDTGISTGASWVTGTVDKVAWVRGRVMVSAGPALYNPTTAYASTAALPAALFTHRNSGFTFVGFAESASHIFAAGFSGDKTEIYSVTIEDDATALGAPKVAAALPDGEVVTAITGYLGLILIGTTNGIRFAVPDAQGNLTIGALIELDATVRCFEGQGKFVWFGWERFDGTSSGLGRLDLSELVDRDVLVPAYASDLMVTSQADVTAVATFNGKRIFALSGDGIFVESADLVAQGTLDSGIIGYGLTERKTALNLILNHDFTDGGEITASLSSDERDFEDIGVAVSGARSDFSGEELEGSSFEHRVRLERNGSTPTKGPRLLSVTLRAYPQVQGTQFIRVPVFIDTAIVGRNGAPQHFDVPAVRARLEGLWSSQRLTTFYDGETSQTVLVADFDDRHEPPQLGEAFSRGTIRLTLKVAR